MAKEDQSEAARIANQLGRAFDGAAWHGDSLFEILAEVTPAQAAARPIQGAHSIWELVLHIAAWDDAVLRRFAGVAVELSDAENFLRLQIRVRRPGSRLWLRLGGRTMI
jgi:uncharacterized damage-inducible protein DinB